MVAFEIIISYSNRKVEASKASKGGLVAPNDIKDEAAEVATGDNALNVGERVDSWVL